MKLKIWQLMSCILPSVLPSTASSQTDSLECQSSYAQFAATQADQIELTEKYAACISSDLRLLAGREYLGFTCEFELNQTVRGQAKVTATLAMASRACTPLRTGANRRSELVMRSAPRHVLPK
jgi:hypothetical protein